MICGAMPPHTFRGLNHSAIYFLQSPPSTRRAIKGMAATVSGTIAALVPMEVPATLRVKGMIATIKMINGIERPMFTIPPQSAIQCWLLQNVASGGSGKENPPHGQPPPGMPGQLPRPPWPASLRMRPKAWRECGQ